MFTTLSRLAHAVQHLEPEKLKYVRLFAMAGTIYIEDTHENGRIADYNIAGNIPTAQRVFNLSWSYFGLAPVGTTVIVQFADSV